MVLAIDRSAPHFVTEGGEPLVRADGTPNEIIQHIKTQLVKHQRQLNATTTVLAELESKGVLHPRQLTISSGAGGNYTVDGFRTVDIEQIGALDDATLGRWVRNGTLEVVYLHLLSLRHFAALIEPSVNASKQPVVSVD